MSRSSIFSRYMAMISYSDMFPCTSCHVYNIYPRYWNFRCPFLSFLLVCERFEPRSHFRSRLSLIVRVNVVLNRTVVVDSDVSTTCAVVIFRVKVSCITSVNGIILSVIDLIGQLRRDVIGRLSVRPWCYWLWRILISNWCVSIRLLSQLNSRLLLVELSVLQTFSRS